MSVRCGPADGAGEGAGEAAEEGARRVRVLAEAVASLNPLSSAFRTTCSLMVTLKGLKGKHWEATL